MKRNILFLAATVLIIIVLVAVGRKVYKDTEKAVVRQFNQQQMLMASQAAQGIEDYFNGVKEELLLLSKMTTIQYLEPQSYFEEMDRVRRSFMPS
ncbi:hypothetical protein ISS37_02610 [candidate division KSB1 bacterium]|nr:hypothetical protein [candidate division KSB1 bacterium]